MVWATWWGGIFFYASVVVPVSAAEIGNLEQGFITQKISRIHNGLSLALIGCLAVEAMRMRSVLLAALTATLFGNVLCLMASHAYLTSEMDFVTHAVPASFYNLHAKYLWLFALEWFQGIAIGMLLLRSLGKPERVA